MELDLSVETSYASWLDNSTMLESDDEDIFARIDLSTISDPFPKLIHLDCNKDSSQYSDWVTDKCFTNVFPVDEACLYDPGLLSDLFTSCRQTILEMKMLGQDQLSKRLSVTNLLHFVHERDLDVLQDLQLIRSLLDNKKFLPNGQDGKQYVHGYFEWKLLLALIAMKTEGAVGILKDICIELVSYSVSKIGDSDLRNVSPFPCKCFESLWTVIVSMTEKLSSDTNIWTLLDISIKAFENNTPDSLKQLKGGGRRTYRDTHLLQLWFHRHFLRCFSADNETLVAQYREIVSRSFVGFLEKEPPEGDLRVALHELRIISRNHQLNVETLIHLWDHLYRRINTNFKTINLDATNSLLVPNDTSVSYINKIRAMMANTEEDNPNLTSYDLFLEMLIRAWQRANLEADQKYQQKFSNRVLLKFSAKLWLPMNEIGIHNLVNLLLVLYHLGDDDRALDRIENILLAVPFAEITHNRRVAVFKGLTAVLIMFYGKHERKSRIYPENFMRKFENAVGVDRFTGRQLICAIDTIFSASPRLNNKEYQLIHPWLKTYLNACTDNDRDVLLDTLTRIMEKYHRLRIADEVAGDAEEVIRRIYQTMEGIIGNYLHAEQEIESKSFVASLMICLKQPIPGVPLVDTLFTNWILNNIRNPRIQLLIVNTLADATKDTIVVHVNNLIKALIKFLVVIDGPVADLKRILCLVKDTKEFLSFCSMDADDFLKSPQPFAVLLKGIRVSFEGLTTDADRDRFHHRFEMYFQMYTKWCLPHMKSAEEALKCYSSTTAMIYICGKLMYPTRQRATNMLKSTLNDFYLTSALLGKKAQPPVVIKAMLKVMHSLLGGLFQLATDEYLDSVISDLIFHWIPQFTNEFNVSGAVLPFLKFTRSNVNTHLPVTLFERFCKVMLTNHLQRDALALRLLREVLNQSRVDVRVVQMLLEGSLSQLLEYYCKCEDFAPVKKLILDFLDDLATINFINENPDLSRILDAVFENWTLSMFHSPNYFELAIKLARVFPVNLRMIMPKLRAEITTRTGQMGSNFAAADRLNQKMRNLEMILQQK